MKRSEIRLADESLRSVFEAQIERFESQLLMLAKIQTRKQKMRTRTAFGSERQVKMSVKLKSNFSQIGQLAFLIMLILNSQICSTLSESVQSSSADSDAESKGKFNAILSTICCCL